MSYPSLITSMNNVHKIRVLFMLAAIAMLLLYPYFSAYIPEPPVLTYVGIIALTVLAAFTTLRGRMLLALDALIAAGGVIVFEYYAADALRFSDSMLLPAVNQGLAVVFLAALYLSIRGLGVAEELADRDNLVA